MGGKSNKKGGHGGRDHDRKNKGGRGHHGHDESSEHLPSAPPPAAAPAPPVTPQAVLLQSRVNRATEVMEQRVPYPTHVVDSLHFLLRLMKLFGLMPIVKKRNIFGRYEFPFQRFSLESITAVLAITISSLICILFFVNFLSVITNVPKASRNMPDYLTYRRDSYRNILTDLNVSRYKECVPLRPSTIRAEEIYIFRRNGIGVVMLLCWAVQAVVNCVVVFERRHFLSYFLSFIVEASEIMQIDLAHNMVAFMRIFILTWVGTTLGFIAISILLPAPTGRAITVIMTSMLSRVFFPEIHALPSFRLKICQAVSAGLLVFIIVSSRAYMFLYMWCCSLIKTGLVVWNCRMEIVILKETRIRSEEENEAQRTGYSHMFTDHVILLDLIQAVDRLFAGPIECYYITAVTSIALEAYYFFRCAIGGPAEFIPRYRRWDCLLFGLLLVQELVIMKTITIAAAEINDEASGGLEVIRKRGFMSRKSDEELFFMLSMYVSYTGHFEISVVCAHYFSMNRGFALTVVNNFCIFMLTLVQLNVPLELVNDQDTLNKLRHCCRISPAKWPECYGQEIVTVGVGIDNKTIVEQEWNRISPLWWHTEILPFDPRALVGDY